MAAALCVAPSRMEHEMDEEEEEVAVALGKTTEKGERGRVLLPGMVEGEGQTNEGPPGAPTEVGGSKGEENVLLSCETQGAGSRKAPS